jgi:hypothetical protein
MVRKLTRLITLLCCRQQFVGFIRVTQLLRWLVNCDCAATAMRVRRCDEEMNTVYSPAITLQ